MSAFDFSGINSNGNITETVKFSSRIDINRDWDTSEGFYGYPYLYARFYVDGVEHKASQDKIDEFEMELAEIIRVFEEWLALEEDASLPWFCGGEVPCPSQVEWLEKKAEFLDGLLAAEPAYNLFPGLEGQYVLYSENSWLLNEENIVPGIRRLADAFYNGDDEFFRTTEIYYNNGGAMCKPVIYLYPAEPTDIRVRVDFPNGGYFTFTYPEYNRGWHIRAYPGGTIINKADGLEYSYLYWSGRGRVNWDFSSGFVVRGSDTVEFLREKLAYLGLTPREYNEFIVYFAPLMQDNNYNLIAFQTTAYEESARLHVSPEPDSILRVFMAYIALENYMNIPAQELERFERTGFSVIEWGGGRVN
jgi:hypothetical protein